MQLLVVYILCFGIAKNCAEPAQEIGNELALPSDNPFHLAKPDFGGNKTITSSSFWPGMSFMERILSALFPPVKAQPQPIQETPLIMWRFRFFFYGNNATEPVPDDATDAVTNTGSSSTHASTVKMSKSSRRKRNQKESLKQLSKAWPMWSYVNSEKRYPGRKDETKKPTNGVKWIRMNDISHNLNKTSNAKDCYRHRLYTYVWAMDWRSVFVHTVILVLFMVCLTVTLVCCQRFINISQQGAVKRFKVIPKSSNKVKIFEV
ncbi:hypothetical protein JTE90_027936 [Oedothorax gibbosus]|uniref:Uncharacterized protein n=1 Tax=Oedothorax gibbosus TaxID=931172 RepID=A0AAV6VEQ6_9ARAC|nr:hypothetical protein JTE90_027936 [Oedothorax gibbosus]